MTDLRVDWCDYKAAKYAVEKWHYSRSVPAGKLVKIGVWEDGQFIGAILFSRGSNKAIGAPFGLEQTEVCELARVALTAHKSFVTEIVARCIAMLRAQDGLRLIVSYADPREGHIGGIYQAGNWVYVGESTGGDSLNRPYQDARGRVIHWRTMSGILHRHGKPHTVENAEAMGYKALEFIPKYKYLYPLDRKMRRQIEPLRKPYPKRDSCGPSVESDTISDQPTEAGATPAGRSEILNHVQP